MKPKFLDLIKSTKIVLADFSAEWCGPCKTLDPILNEVKRAIGDKAIIVKVDVDNHIELATTFKIQAVPTLILFKDGELKWKESGVKPANELIDLINKFT